jgi:hypothetical protein
MPFGCRDPDLRAVRFYENLIADILGCAFALAMIILLGWIILTSEAYNFK